jgi:hypothetical protein
MKRTNMIEIGLYALAGISYGTVLFCWWHHKREDPTQRLGFRYHGWLARYHRRSLGHHCSYLPGWYIEKILDGKIEE